MIPPRKSGSAVTRNAAPSLDTTAPGLGHSCPPHCPPRCPQEMAAFGAPLSIRDAAKMIGCSAWTVRQTLMPRGLPHFRCGGGKLLFYKNQIIRWIESQQKGTM